MGDAVAHAEMTSGRAPDHEYPIATVKTEFRDAWNAGDVARLRTLLDP